MPRQSDVPGEPLLSVVIVAFRRPERLGSCLGSVREAVKELEPPVEVVVVDNSPGDEIGNVMRSDFPEVQLLRIGENVGFASGVMRGLRATRGPWIALLNDDLTIDPKALTALLEAGCNDPSVGAVAAQLRFAHRPDIINSAGIQVDRLGVSTDRLLGAAVEESEREPIEVFGASGGAALYRRSMLDDLGGFDESFFAYLEDVDLAWRARMRGWRALYAPDAVAYHHHSATLGHGSASKLFLVGRNRVRLLAKNATTGTLLRYGLGIAVYDLAYVAFAAMRYRTLAPLRGRLSGLRDWPCYRRSGSAGRTEVSLAPAGGARAALRRDRVWERKGPG
jgi:GT2 family glycosyltransferase